ncbi:MAG: DUF2726 domain-containing protein [Nitrospira sp. SB0672_bin_25]|nr:DUF2726 domain-containing protein [Nitrospira sp. SB0666_bin_27]MYF24644.1 DUF2726 domain-containing protein [Nitrospira sp. SB0678_bin_10]MYJ54586.1 DUF2726 domain-containing protein [Nitrospira sp. SB0672_bin_25]
MDLFGRVLEKVLEWLPLASHPPLSQLLVAGLILLTGFVFVLMRPRRRQSGPAHDAWIDGIEERVTAKPQPLLNDAEVSVFNLLLLAVRDHFLLLSKVPLRNLLQLRVEDDSSKRAVAQALRNVTVDFVLVHPGTRLPVKAVFLEKPGDDATASQAQEWLREALLLKAGIAVIWLDQEVRYSVEQLTHLLDLEEEP